MSDETQRLLEAEIERLKHEVRALREANADLGIRLCRAEEPTRPKTIQEGIDRRHAEEQSPEAVYARKRWGGG